MSGQKKFSYTGFRYSQAEDTQNLVTFVAPAGEVMQWAGIPTKSSRNKGGFQRALDKRYIKIKKYFESGELSPGAVVVAFRHGSVTVSELPQPSNWAAVADNFVNIEFSVEDLNALTFDELRGRVLKLLDTRLSGNTDDEDDDVEDDEDVEQDDTVTEFPPNTGDSSIVDESDEDSVDIGRSTLKRYRDWLSNDEKVREYIGPFNAPEADQSENVTGDDATDYAANKEKLSEQLKSALRPAIIVDGQHRINGAYHSESPPISFTICAIPDASWEEQVFQFVVLNKTARAISKDFLNDILSTSLTNSELQSIDARLKVIGFNNIDRPIYQSLEYDEKSPFMGLIAQANEVDGNDSGGKLSQRGMINLARTWKSLASQKDKRRIELFWHICEAQNITDLRNKWRSDINIPMRFFFEFWNTVKAHYKPQGLWVKGESRLFLIVTFGVMQELWIDNMADGARKFQNPEEFRSAIQNFLNAIPATFFQGWEGSQQNSAGQKLIRACMVDFQKGLSLTKVKERYPQLWKKK